MRYRTLEVEYNKDEETGDRCGINISFDNQWWIIDPNNSQFPYILISGIAGFTKFGHTPGLNIITEQEPIGKTLDVDNDNLYLFSRSVIKCPFETMPDPQPIGLNISTLDDPSEIGITVISGVRIGMSLNSDIDYMSPETYPLSGLMRGFVSNEGFIKGHIIGKYANNATVAGEQIKPWVLYSIYPQTEMSDEEYDSRAGEPRWGDWITVVSGGWPENLIDIEHMEQPDYARVLFAVSSGVLITSFENQFSDPTPANIHFTILSGVEITDIASVRMY